MILTITPNPSIDYLFEAETLCWDDANRVEMPRRRAGGQGINLTRAARVLGGESVALALFGGSAGHELQSMLEQEGTRFIAVPMEAETRVFFGVRETSTGRSMLVNARGPVLKAEDRERLLVSVQAACAELKPSWVVCAGSVPRGLGHDLYARICDVAHAHHARFIADCDGEQLANAVARGCDLIAPNKHEAERLTYLSICSAREAGKALASLRALAPEVYLKLGAQGAVAATGDAMWLAHGPQLQSGSAVGAGDAFLAALLVAKENGAPPEEALHSAVAAGTAVLLSRGRDLLTRSDYDHMRQQVQRTTLSAV
ncbi:MAG TPA: hexose kinase [Longimicrobiales bacterium]